MVIQISSHLKISLTIYYNCQETVKQWLKSLMAIGYDLVKNLKEKCKIKGLYVPSCEYGITANGFLPKNVPSILTFLNGDPAHQSLLYMQ